MIALSLALPAVRRAGPTLDLMFSGSTLDSRITFTRASTATYRDNTGTRQTAAVNAARLNHTAAGVALGLLIEEQRTNILLNSATLATQDVTTAAVPYTLTFEGTGTITLTGTSTAGPLVGTGASNRVSLTFTPTAGTLTLTVSGSVTAAQLEAGSFGTSWIPTTGAQATRAADVANITGSTFSGFYNQSEGTFLWEGDTFASGGTSRSLFSVRADDNNYIQNRFDSSNAVIDRLQASGSSSCVLNSAATVAANTVIKDAFAYRADDFARSLNGATVQTDTSGAVPTLTALHLGSYAGNSEFLSGHIRRLAYYPQRLAGPQLQALTA